MPGPQDETPAIKRLAALVTQCRAARGWSKEKAAAEAGLSYTTYTRVEEGERVQATSYMKLERGLGIAPGACRAVLDGAELLTLADGSELFSDVRRTPFAIDSVADGVKGGVASAAILTTPGLTGHEINALGEQVVEELRKRGIIPGPA